MTYNPQLVQCLLTAIADVDINREKGAFNKIMHFSDRLLEDRFKKEELI